MTVIILIMLLLGAISYLQLPVDLFPGPVNPIVQIPVPLGPADPEEKVGQNYFPRGGMGDLRMKLKPVKMPGGITHSRDGNLSACGQDDKPIRKFRYPVGMTHPDLKTVGKAMK